MAEAGISEESTQGLAEAIRPYLRGEGTDAGQTKDRLGIFFCGDKEVSQQVGSFLVNILNQTLALERGINHGFAGVSSKQNFTKLQHLVTTLARVAYWPVDPKKQIVLRERFGAEAKISKYNPPSIYPVKIPTHRYNFDQVASLELRVTDYKLNNVLIFEFFPLRYSQYWITTKNGRRDFPDLNGVTLKEARQVLSSRHRVSPDQVHEALENAGKTLIEPYFKLHLEDTDGQQLSALEGDVVTEGNKTGLNLYCLDFPGIGVFLSLPGAKKDQNVSLRSLASGFLKLGVKESVKANLAA